MEAEDESESTMEDMCSNSAADDVSLCRPPVNGGEQLDIEAYCALYSGRTKIMRLLFIAEKCDNTSVQLEALKMAYGEIKKGMDTELFGKVVHKIDGRLGPDYGPDGAWVDAADLQAKEKKERLENELSSYMKSDIKESIRMGNNDSGDFYYARGQLPDALESYIMACSYCSTPNQIIHMCLNVILVSIEMSQFADVISYVIKAEQSQDALDPITMSKLFCVVGLVHLDAKKYKLAAQKFLEVHQELRNSYTEVIAPQDVSIYGGLCALACFDRAELKSKVIDNANFMVFLDLVPALKEVIQDFYSCHYALCLECLGNLKENLLLDIHLHDHVETLFGLIRNRALVQYTHPFVTVDLRIMSHAFKTTVPGLEKELQSLITTNRIKARIDSQNKILYAQHADLRKITFQKVLENGCEFARDVRSMLLRANLVELDPYTDYIL